MQILDGAVGAGTLDRSEDVARVRELLGIAGFDDAPLAGMGLQCSFEEPGGVLAPPMAPAPPDLSATIRRFQSEVVGLRVPDGRIDPGGETIATLVAEARKRVALEHRVSRVFGDARVTAAINTLWPNVVLGSIQKPELISPRTHAALRLLGYCCGLSELKITEGIRTYEMMASYFLRKITNGTRGVRGEAYRHALEILDEHNGGKPYAKGSVPDEHVQAVADRMRERCEELGVRVSMHVVSEDEYRALNVVDLGWNSNPKLKERTRARVFARLLDACHVRNKKARHRFVRTYYPPHHLNAVLDTAHGREIKIENAWHIEIEVGAVPATIV